MADDVIDKDDVGDEEPLKVVVTNQPEIKEAEEDDDDGYLQLQITKEQIEDIEVED